MGIKLKIGLRGGHSKNCVGAEGVVKEYDQMQMYFLAVKAVLEAYGHTVIDCNSNGYNASQELSEGATKANNNNVDLFISLHMNASNGQGHGTEALVSGSNTISTSYAQRLCDNFEQLGFTNRGVKIVQDYEMRHVSAPNIIFETCFCDNQADIDIFNKYSWGKLAHAFCNAIDSSISASTETVDGSWEQTDGKWWYKLTDGSYPASKWVQIDGFWYFFDNEGYMKTGWFKFDDEWYLCWSNGKMATGWVEDRSKWYYLNANGSMVHSCWKWIDGECYYFGTDGRMACNEVTPDGYTVDETGAWDSSIPKK